MVVGKNNPEKKVGPKTRKVTTLLYVKQVLFETFTRYLNPSRAVIDPLVLL